MEKNLIEILVEEKIASNPFHAANMLNVLECYKCRSDEERIDRCRLYKAWKLAGENKTIARKNAIDGIPAPVSFIPELPRPEADQEENMMDKYINGGW